jgi:hypothetical protein
MAEDADSGPRSPRGRRAKGAPVEVDSPRPRRPTSTGRVTVRAEQSRRYTPPIPKAKRRSPPWYPYVLVGLLLLGLLLIVLNYVEVLPASPDTFYLVGGLVAILGGAVMSTQYH